MDVRKWSVLTLCSCATVLGCVGCLGAPLGSRTNNQGGGTIISAGLKVSQNSLSRLTADEVQILADLVMEQRGVTTVDPVTDEQAAAVVDFLEDNNINSFEDVANLDPNEVVIPDSVEDVIDSLEDINLDDLGLG